MNQRVELSEKQNLINNDGVQLVKTKRKWVEKGDIHNFQEEKDNSFVIVQNSERGNQKSKKHQNEKNLIEQTLENDIQQARITENNWDCEVVADCKQALFIKIKVQNISCEQLTAEDVEERRRFAKMGVKRRLTNLCPVRRWKDFEDEEGGALKKVVGRERRDNIPTDHYSINKHGKKGRNEEDMERERERERALGKRRGLEP
ncbi:hypothetical protein AXF42_Ash009429 [Apostasia shenzhenica]|uniref:Uncharacterized protein n=1 Tax=Apostasia shenzhenica TaxID=1088818 RepID=A0A2I0B8V7_9ASPA|nr:hypothetical protein AXF42_Ash009429 [Apostasia shenzhenica]